MDYKKIFKNQQLRFSILKALSFVSDSTMLSWQYRIKTGRKLNLKNPIRYTEKIQLYKMYYRNPDLPICVDKYEVRSYVSKKGLSHILNILYGVYDVAEDINFKDLPDRFVIKTTDGGGGQNILMCHQKAELDIPKTILDVNSWLNKKDIDPGREWAYTRMKKSRIIVEKLLEDPEKPEAGIQDYKFFCFSGKPLVPFHEFILAVRVTRFYPKYTTKSKNIVRFCAYCGISNVNFLVLPLHTPAFCLRNSDLMNFLAVF